ncbi:MAG: hypothetical protein IJW21_00440 [Clostridia bacterium]|nr:hypothetical protein [Clostridia bacterium]
MTLEKLKGYIKDGREMEFRLYGRKFFHSHNGVRYSIYACANEAISFEGSLE